MASVALPDPWNSWTLTPLPLTLTPDLDPLLTS